MKELTLKVLLLVVTMVVIGLAYNAGKREVYKKDYKYFEKTEALLDSISNWDESFMDTVMETDAYYEYELAKYELTKEKYIQ